MHRYPLLPVVTAFAVGVVATHWLGGEWRWGALVTILASAVAILLRQRLAWVLLAAVSVGMLDTAIQSPYVPEPLFGKQALLSGTVLECREGTETKVAVVAVDSVGGKTTRRFDAILYLPDEEEEPQPTDRVHAAVALEPLDRQTVIPDEIDYDEILRRRGITARGIVLPADFRVVGPDGSIVSKIKRLGAVARQNILVSGLSDKTKEFLVATLLGDDSLIPETEHELFARAGIAHVLALSGLHVGVISVMISVMLFPLYVLRKRTALYVVTIVLLWGYAVMTGLNHSVVRAVIMASALLIAKIMQRPVSPLNTISLAALLILAVSPTAIYTIGFQLTFSAVIAIIVLTPQINQVSRRRRPWLWRLVGFFAVTLAAMAGTTPLAAYYFHIFPVYFFLGNIAASFLLPPLLFLGAASALGLDFSLLNTIADWLYSVLSASTEAVCSLPGVAITGIYPAATTLALYYIGIGSLALWLARKRIVYGAATGAIFLCIAVSYLSTNSVNPGDEVIIDSDKRQTSVILRRGATASLYSNAVAADLPSVRANYESRLRNYLGKRGIDSLTVSALPRSSHLRFDAMGRRYVVFGSQPDTTLRADVGIITRSMPRSRSDARTLRALLVDSILVSSDVPSRRASRYLTLPRTAPLTTLYLR